MAALAIVLLSTAGGAQVAAPFDPFAPPKRGPQHPLLCRSTPIPPGDSAAFHYTYVEGDAITGGRETLLDFDSTGVLLRIQLIAVEDTASAAQTIYVYAAQFRPARVGRQARFADRAAMALAARGVGLPSLERLTDPALAPIDAETLGRLQELGRYFWAHRCEDRGPS